MNASTDYSAKKSIILYASNVISDSLLYLQKSHFSLGATDL